MHESIIGSLFDGRVEATARVGNHDAIVPSISGWARQHGINTIFVDERDPFAHGFQVLAVTARLQPAVRLAYSAAFTAGAGAPTPPRAKMASISAGL